MKPLRKTTIAGLISLLAISASATADKHREGERLSPEQRQEKMEERLNATLSADQVQTLVEARLIQRGKTEHQVANVDANSDGYLVTIEDENGEVVKEIQVGKNGLPERMEAKIRERMANN